jgi:hypothetical protein
MLGLTSPLLSSGQSSWLQIRRPGFNSQHYQKKSSGSGTGPTQPQPDKSARNDSSFSQMYFVGLSFEINCSALY